MFYEKSLSGEFVSISRELEPPGKTIILQFLTFFSFAIFLMCARGFD